MTGAPPDALLLWLSLGLGAQGIHIFPKALHRPPLGARSPTCAGTRIAPKRSLSSEEAQGKIHPHMGVSAQLGLRAPRGIP